MPTPESPLFLAKKPKVPPTFDGVDYNDTMQLKAAQDAIIREQWVKSMMARLIREKLGECYAKEGVGHLEKCGGLRGKIRIYYRGNEVEDSGADKDADAERYFEALKEAKVRGYLFQQQNYSPRPE